MYESIELSRLAELAPFTTPTELERVVVETACSNGIQVKACAGCAERERVLERERESYFVW